MGSYIACLRSAPSVRSSCHRFYQLSFVAFSVNLLISKCTSLGRLGRSQGAHWVCLLCPHCEGAGLWQNNVGMMQFKRKFLCRMPTCFSCFLGGLSGKAPKMSSPKMGQAGSCWSWFSSSTQVTGWRCGVLLQHHLMSSCCGDKNIGLSCQMESKGTLDASSVLAVMMVLAEINILQDSHQ